ncbi:MAG: c-type cytochrome domain-containing protein, partial [Planctomycetia bacterium]
MRICAKSPILWLLLLGLSTPACGDQIEYNRDIRPILTETCFSCHGPDSASRKADLRLDQRDAAVTAGALVPGSPDNSEVIRRILSENPEEVMPPPAMKKSLTTAQKELLAEWIRSGAEYQPHWSFLTPVAAEVPNVPKALAGRWSQWSKNPIDGFILEKLETAGLIPGEEADRRVLARRAALDITGLPPSATLLQEFLHDSSPDAYERY